MKTASVCKMCWGEGTKSDGTGCCAGCHGIGAKIPDVTRAEWAAASPAALDATVTFSFAALSMTRMPRAQSAIATFIARCALAQTGKAQEATLVMLRGRGFALIANAAEARVMAAAQRASVARAA